MDYRGIPLCNRGRRPALLSSLFFFFYRRPPREALVMSFLPREASSSGADLISTTPSVAYNFPRVGLENRYLPGTSRRFYTF